MVSLARTNRRESLRSNGNDSPVSSRGQLTSIADGSASDVNAGKSQEERELAEDEFIVETIIGHSIKGACKGRPYFKVKWKGFDKKSDMTMEPEHNLENCTVLKDYYDQIGGRDNIFKGSNNVAQGRKGNKGASGALKPPSKKRQRRDDTGFADLTPPTSLTDWSPPPGSWEDEEVTIVDCEDAGNSKLTVYLTWKNRRKTKHDASVIYKKCPQKFYERHVKFAYAEGQSSSDQA